MNLQPLQCELETRIEGSVCIPIERTPLHACAQEILGMVSSYLHDGASFLNGGDLPNALASFTYALGWFDAGFSLGLISSKSCGLPIIGADPWTKDSGDPQMEEKTWRYYRLLATACRELTPAPEKGSCLYSTGERFLLIAQIFLDSGHRHEESGDLFAGLAAYSYGFGWLDAGVRTGLFRISNNRDLFTI
jgi:hypothetical protein